MRPSGRERRKPPEITLALQWSRELGRGCEVGGSLGGTSLSAADERLGQGFWSAVLSRPLGPLGTLAAE